MPERRCKCECGPLIEYVAVFFSAANVINAGMEYGWTSAAFPVLLIGKDNQTQPLLTSDQGLWVATLPHPGAVLGSLLAAFSCDYLGRKSLILFSCVPYTIHWLLIALTKEYYFLYIARFLSGFSSGIALSSIPLYIDEICRPKLKRYLCGMSAMCLAIGVFLMNLMHLNFTIRLCAFISLAFPVASFVGLLFMPESPYFLLTKNKEKKALRSVRIFRRREDVETDFKNIKRAVEKDKRIERGIKALLTVPVNRRSLFILAILRAGQPLCGITTLVYYSSVILEAHDITLPVEDNTLIFTTTLMLSVFVGLLLLDCVGRRALLALSLVGAFLCLLMLAIYFNLKNHNVDVSQYYNLPIVTMVIIVLFHGVGLQHVPYVMQGELFTTGVRSFAICAGMILFSVFSLVCTIFYQALNENGSSHHAFYTFTLFCIITFFLVFFFVPETTYLTLEQVQLMINQREIDIKNVI